MEECKFRIAQVVGKMNSGGVESVVLNYYKNIDREKVQFDFIVDEDSTYIPQELIEEFGGRIYIIPPYQHLFSYMKTLIKLFKTNKYSIVHSHINSLSIFPLCAVQIAKVKIRIAHSHSSSGNNEFKRNIIKYILRPFSKVFPNCFFACSNFAGRWLFGEKIYGFGKSYNIKQCN